MGTLGKALGASGGYICGSRALIDFLVNRARSFIFSAPPPCPPPPPPLRRALRLAQSAEGSARRKALWQLVELLNSKFKNQKSIFRSAIIPLIIGDENKAVDLASELRAKNIFVPAIRYPTVARGTARLRVTLTAAHSTEDAAQLVQALADLKLEIADLKLP